MQWGLGREVMGFGNGRMVGFEVGCECLHSQMVTILMTSLLSLC